MDTSFWSSFLRALPSVSSSKSALYAYIIATIIWGAIAVRVNRNRNLLASLKKLPAKDRIRALQLEMGSTPLPSDFSGDQWLRAKIMRYYFAAALLFLLLAAFLIAQTAYYSQRPSKTDLSDALRLDREIQFQLESERQRKQEEQREKAQELTEKRRRLEKLGDIDCGMTIEYVESTIGVPPEHKVLPVGDGSSPEDRVETTTYDNELYSAWFVFRNGKVISVTAIIKDSTVTPFLKYVDMTAGKSTFASLCGPDDNSMWIDAHSTPWAYAEYVPLDPEMQEGSFGKIFAYSALGAQYAPYDSMKPNPLTTYVNKREYDDAGHNSLLHGYPLHYVTDEWTQSHNSGFPDSTPTSQAPYTYFRRNVIPNAFRLQSADLVRTVPLPKDTERLVSWGRGLPEAPSFASWLFEQAENGINVTLIAQFPIDSECLSSRIRPITLILPRASRLLQIDPATPRNYVQLIGRVRNAVLVLIRPTVAQFGILNGQSGALVHMLLHEPCSRAERHSLEPTGFVFRSAVLAGALVVNEAEAGDLAVLGPFEDFRFIAGPAVVDADFDGHWFCSPWFRCLPCSSGYRGCPDAIHRPSPENSPADRSQPRLLIGPYTRPRQPFTVFPCAPASSPDDHVSSVFHLASSAASSGQLMQRAVRRVVAGLPDGEMRRFARVRFPSENRGGCGLLFLSGLDHWSANAF